MARSAYLLTWNSDEEFRSGKIFAKYLAEVANGSTVEMPWRLPYNTPEVGDICFIKCNKNGTVPGIFAKGTFVGKPYVAKKSGKRLIKILLDSILPPGMEFPYDQIVNDPPFNKDKIEEMQWSGRELRPSTSDHLLKSWPRVGKRVIKTLPDHQYFFLPKKFWPKSRPYEDFRMEFGSKERAEVRSKESRYWLFNVNGGPEAAEIWFDKSVGVSGDTGYGEPLGRLGKGDFVLMYQNHVGYVGIGRVKQEWNQKAYTSKRSKLVFKDFDFEEYRIDINWEHDLRATPIEIGYVSPNFLCQVHKGELIERIEDVISTLEKGHTPRILPDDGADFEVNDRDERLSAMRSILHRRGQQTFRKKLLKRYGVICQITGCEIKDVLEAAHIHPYMGEKDNHLGNGLMLRADIHTLFDLDLIGIDPKTLKIHLAIPIEKEYEQVVQKTLICRDNKRPSPPALRHRWEKFKHYNYL